MACTGCFGGCSEIAPDKCIKYTGADVPSLEISNGDNLLSVEQKIIEYLLGVLNGSGISISIDAGYLCTLVSGYLNSSSSLDDIIVAIIRSICNIDSRIDSIEEDVANIESSYFTSCLSGVNSNSTTHQVVQAIITTLCSLSASFTALVNSLPPTYVALSDLNTLIQEYLDSVSSGSAVKNKMIPYVAYPYFRDPGANFSVSGVGLGDWTNVYLCNGLNGTPDLRGRVLVATTTGMGGEAFSSTVDPSIAGNPNYSLNTTQGQNNITLSTDQIPTHSHATSINITDNGHTHFEFANIIKGTQEDNTLTNSNYSYRKLRASNNSDNYDIQGTPTAPTVGKTSLQQTGITTTVTNPSIGGGQSHSNIQPVIACNYIMYII